jgi:hypothetical protein
MTDPTALSGPLAAASFAAGLASADSPYPRPGSSAQQIQQYVQGSATAARRSIAGQLVSSAALAAFGTSVARFAGCASHGSRALQVAAVAGGAVAAASLAASALMSAALTGDRGRDERTATELHRRAFLAGGPVHGAGFRLLLGALGLAGLRTGELPKPLSIAALATASAGLLSPLYLVAEQTALLIPAGRFPGLVVAAIAGTRLAVRPGPDLSRSA